MYIIKVTVYYDINQHCILTEYRPGIYTLSIQLFLWLVKLSLACIASMNRNSGSLYNSN